MKYPILSLLVLFLCAGNLYAQVNMTTSPSDDYGNCEYQVAIENHSGYLAWLANNGGGVASSDCGGIITWTVDAFSIDYQFGCNNGYMQVDWLVTDDCSNDTYYTSSYYEVNGDYPYLQGGEDLYLDCGDPNNDALITTWLNSSAGGTTNNPCTPHSDYIITNTYNGTIPECENYEGVEFIISDNCVTNISSDYHHIFIENTKIQFSASSFYGSEADPSIEFCIEVLDHALQAPVLIDVAFSVSSNFPATNGVDYGPVMATENYTIPPMAAGIICFQVPLINDNLVEENERIDIDIVGFNSTIDEAELYYRTDATLIINDDDDVDNDNVENSVDNCPSNFNPFQEDIDTDGIGDVCDGQNIVSELHNVEDNIFLDKNSSGVITRSPDGNCWMLYVQNDGQVKTVNVVCPN